MTTGEPVVYTGTYGERINFEEYSVDLGAVSDSSLVYIRDELLAYLASGASWERNQTLDDLIMVWQEIAGRVLYCAPQEEDLDNAWRCRLGCCD